MPAWTPIALTILLGVSITLVRIVMPTIFAITPGLVVLETLLELALCAAAIALNRKELKEAIFRKLTGKDFLNIVLTWALINIASLVFNVVCSLVFKAAWGLDYAEATSLAPAAVIGERFKETLLIGPLLTMCITAPVLEEISFRMTFRKVFKNNIFGNILYIIVPSLLFGFIHTASFGTLGIVYYVFYGCAMAVVYLKTKDIRLNIGAHILTNTMIYVTALIGWLVSLPA
jgi:membrane protease YdiL (CAAX protease family)